MSCDRCFALGACEKCNPHRVSFDQNGFGATDVEAALTQEVWRLVAALLESASSFQAIGERSPSGDLGKLVAQSFQLIALQYAQTFLQLGGHHGFLGEHAEQLGDMGLSFEEAFREICLDGRKFLAIACIDKSFGKRDCGGNV